MGSNGYQQMVLEYYVGNVRGFNRYQDINLKCIANRDEAIDYQNKIRKAIKSAFSPRPRKTPLNPKITGMLQRNGYRIEKILFESRPNCLVSAIFTFQIT
mgnify:CR=1 FL=1